MRSYQESRVLQFLNLLPRTATTILEIGSDKLGLVTSRLMQKTDALVVGVNPASYFPDVEAIRQRGDMPALLRGNGCDLPFQDGSFDAVISLATLEHVHGIDTMLAEVVRVLKPKGLFYAGFGPIWSSAIGHHVTAKWRSKEALFSPPAKNPIPDHAHLLMTPDEMSAFLETSPCCDELIAPIIEWLYHGDEINRVHYEEYLKIIEDSPFEVQSLMPFSGAAPDPESSIALRAKFGKNRNFTTGSVTVVLRKPPDYGSAQRLLFKSLILQKRFVNAVTFRCYVITNKYFPETKHFVKWILRLKARL